MRFARAFKGWKSSKMTISKAVWNYYKLNIYDLYFQQNKTMEEVVQIMSLKGLKAKY